MVLGLGHFEFEVGLSATDYAVAFFRCEKAAEACRLTDQI
jgi:hypothetical protein